MLRQLILAVLLLTGCAPSPGEVYVQRRFLFIGNSLTYYNDLPGTVQAIAGAAGEDVHVAAAAEPNLALIDHLNGQSDALRLLRSSAWDFVVMQQGPSTTTANRDSLVLWTGMFQPHVQQSGARPALLMVWPRENSLELMDDVRVSYQQASAAVGGIFLPAGEAWRFALAADSMLQLYAADGFHPSELGTYLTAVVIYARLTGIDPRTLPSVAYAGGRRLTTSPATIELLQRAAFDAITRYPNPN